jgi:6-phosphogluconolactonase
LAAIANCGGASQQGGGSGGKGGGTGGAGVDGAVGLDVAASGGSAGGTGGSGGASELPDAATDLTDLRTDVAAPGDMPAGPTTSYVYVSGYAPPITAFTLNMSTGALAAAGMATTGTGGEPTSLAFSPDKRVLYAGDEQKVGPMSRLIAYAINPATGALQEINRQGTGGMVNAHLGVHPSGKWVVSANYGTGDVTVFPVRADGGLDAGLPRVPAGGEAHYILFDSTGQFLLVPCVAARHIAIFRFSNGMLTPANPPTVAVAGSPRHLVFSRDEQFVYALTQGESTIFSFRFDKTTGGLTPIETVNTTPSGSLGAHIAVHPSGKFLFASNRGDNSVATFTIDAGSGRLTRIGFQRDMISTPWWFAIEPTGQWMLVASDRTASVSVHRIDQTTGMLQRVGAPVTVAMRPTYVGVLIMP